MIATFVLAWLAQDATPAPARVRWELAAASVGVGEGVEALLVVEHAAGARARLSPDWSDNDYSWLELSPARLDVGSSRTETRWRVELASLEAGERELPQPAVEVDLPGGTKATLEYAPRSLRFQPALFEGEDAPREPRDFRAAESEDSAAHWTWYVAGGLALALAGAACGWLLRSRRKPVELPPSATARLAELGTRRLDDSAVVRELYYDLSLLVRGELDARAGVRREACTDEEWLASARKMLAPEVATTLEQLLLSCRGAKYAAARPTEWAVREDLTRAAQVLDGAGGGARGAA